MEPSSDTQRTAALASARAPEASATEELAGPGRSASSTWPLAQASDQAAALPAVPGYKVLGEIARGGMGRVLAARDETLDREVAIKVLLPGAPAGRFLSESKITARLPHPGIPPAHALGTLADGSPFLVMKLIRGRTLGEELAARADVAADLPRFVRIFEQIAEAVGFAHSQGILHRDLKPTNVMVGAFGEVQVMDWGLAKSLGEAEAEPGGAAAETAPHVTAAGAVVGTPRYMSPEQARGEPLEAATDVFSLGAILAQILTNEPVYAGSSAQEILARAAAGDVAAAFARLDRCGADAPLIDLAKRCLNPDPAARPRDGAEVAALVAAHRAAVEERLRTAEVEAAAALVRSAEERKRSRLRLALAGMALLLAALVGLGAWYAQRQESARKQQAIEREQQALARQAERAAARARAEQTVAAARAQLVDLQRRALWKEAERTLGQAEAAVGGEPENADLAAEIAAARRDLALVARLDETALQRTAPRPAARDLGSVFGYLRGMSTEGEAVNPAIAAALREHGIDVLHGPTDEATEKIRNSPIKEHLLAALDDWMFHERNPLVQLVLWKITTELGSEPWRAKLPTHSLSAELSKKLLADTPLEERTPALYLFLDGVCAYWNVDGLAELREGCRRYPGHFFLNYSLAGALQRRYRESRQPQLFNESLAACRAALAIRPESGSVWKILAALYLEANDIPAMLDCSSRALALLPGDAGAMYWHGSALWHSGKSAEAVPILRESLRLQPDSAATYEALAMALKRAGDRSGAISAWREAIRLSPESPSLYFNLGYDLHEAGEDTAAVPEFRICAELSKGDTLSLVRCAFHLEELGDRSAMQQALDEARQINRQQFEGILENHMRSRRKNVAEWLAGARSCRVPGEIVVFGRLAIKENRRYLAVAERCQAEFAQRPQWELWPPDPPLYLAACCAAQAAAGQGDGMKLKLPERSAWRAQALEWLKKYLTHCRAGLADQGRRETALAALAECREDRSFISLRATNLMILPAEERPAWQALWAELDSLLDSPPASEPK